MKFLRFLLLFIILGNTMMSTAEVLDIKQDEKKGTWGYVNEKGKWAIKPKYIDATDFFLPYNKAPYREAPEMIAFVSPKPGIVQIINLSGEVLIEFKSSETRMENFRNNLENYTSYNNRDQLNYTYTIIPVENNLSSLLIICDGECRNFGPFEEIYPLISSDGRDHTPNFMKKNNGEYGILSFNINSGKVYNKICLESVSKKIESEEYYFQELEPGILLAKSGEKKRLIFNGNVSNDVWGSGFTIFQFRDYKKRGLPVFLLLEGKLLPLKNFTVYYGLDFDWVAGMANPNKFILIIKKKYGKEKIMEIDVDGEYNAITHDVSTDYKNIIVTKKNGNDFFMVNLDKEAIIEPFKTTAEAEAILNQPGEKDYLKALKLYLDVADLLKAFPQTTINIYNSIVENIFKECNDKAAIIKTVKSYEPSEFINTTIYRYNIWGPGYLFPNKSGSNDLYSLDGNLLVSGDRYDSFVSFNQYNKNLFIFKKDGKYGAFNLNGDQVIAPTHTEFAGDNSAKKRFCFRDRLANGSDKYFVYDDKGNLLTEEVFTDLNSRITERKIQNFLSTWM